MIPDTKGNPPYPIPPSPDEPPKPDPVFRMQNRIFYAVFITTGVALFVGIVLQWPFWLAMMLHGFAIGMGISMYLISYARLKVARAEAEKALEKLEAVLDKQIEGLDGFLKGLMGSQKDAAKNMGWDEEWFKP